jgi:hypothetical protein
MFTDHLIAGLAIQWVALNRRKNWLTTAVDVGIIRATFWDIAHFQMPQHILQNRHT